VKSQIGHTKAAAGVAGLLKAALALHQKVLPPTNNVERPNPKLEIGKTPFYVNTETRPWIQPEGEGPRRAGVSAFGFGGTNFHVVLEEYQPDHDGAYRLHAVAQPVILQAATPRDLLIHCEKVLGALSGANGADEFRRVTAASKAPEIPLTAARLGFVADSLGEAAILLGQAIATLRVRPEADAWDHPRGIWYRSAGLDPTGHLVALFPGQGAQYLGMGSELAMSFPPLRETIGRLDRLFLDEGSPPLSSVLYPPPVFDQEAVRAQEESLMATDYAQASIGALSAGLFTLLAQAGFRPDFTAGHSFGELSALWAGGVLSDADFLSLVKARGKAMRPPVDSDGEGPDGFDAGTMAAVQGAREGVEAEIRGFSGVIVANDNSNTQVVIAGPKAQVRAAVEALNARGFKATLLPVSAAFHTSAVSHASKPFAAAVAPTEFHQPRAVVYSNTTGQPYPLDTGEAKELLANHILKPVLFRSQIESIYASGGRIFVEFGPRRITTGLVEDILTGRPYVAVALNPSRGKSSDRQFREAVVQLRVAGVSLGNVDPYEDIR
jgi:acyl transferase domain-containing protein